ncbi:MAG TPA: response regulator [Prolixibacteraceae bacterium]|nr:response regulator [Prolixibacteraceae bacterium]
MEFNPNLKILLAEDDKINQRIMILTFRHMGVKCDIASNGKEALEMYQQNLYNLILMDMQMPVMNGLEASRQIRAFEKETGQINRVFIVALTGNDISDKKEECLEAGMDDFMEKPLQDKLFVELFSRL